MTHDELVKLGAAWAKKRRFAVIMQDVRSNAVTEQPDVIAWKNSASSLLIECKASRADFLRDAKKSFRRDSTRGMGFERYMLISKPFAVEDEMPAGWGLLVVASSGRSVVLAKKSAPFTRRNERDERMLLISAVRRVTEGWGRRTFGEDAPLAADGDPHPTASKIIRELREENHVLRAQMRRLLLQPK